jgi:hypothetical protein
LSNDKSSAESVAEILSQLATIERNLDRPETIQVLLASMQNLNHVEALLSRAALPPAEHEALRARLAAVKAKNKLKIDLALPWPMTAMTSRGKNPEELVAKLEHPNYWVRCMAAREMRAKAEKITDEAAAALTDLLSAPANSSDEDVRRWTDFALGGLPARRGDKIQGLQCTTCHRVVAAGEVCLLSASTVNANDDYAMFAGCSNPFIDANAIPTPPRNPLELSEWNSVLRVTRLEWIQMAKSNVKQQGPGWDPPWPVCLRCAQALGVSGEDLAKAKEAGTRHVAGEKVDGVVTEAGRKLMAQVNSKCFVCTVAFGDAEAPEVVALRMFRDQWLSQRRWGTALVALYELIGPRAAAIVERLPRLRRRLRSWLQAVAPVVRRRFLDERA